MLKPELARQELTKLGSPKNTDARLNRVKKLPKASATIGLGLLGRNADGTSINDYHKRNGLVTKSMADLTAKPKERAAIFNALFPSLAADLEAAWKVINRLPYTEGYDRRAFRAPTRPELYADRKGTWITNIFTTLSTYPDNVLSAEWLAAWAIHMYGYDSLAYVLAGAIERGGKAGDTVFEILKDSASNRHEIGGMGSHVARALLCVTKPEAW